MIWAGVPFPSLDFIFRRGYCVVISFKRGKWSLVYVIKRRIRSEWISFHELIVIIETLLKGKRWNMKGFVWHSIRAIDVQLIHWCCKSIFWGFLRCRVNEKGIEWFCYTFMVLYLLHIWRLPHFQNEAPHSRYGGPPSQICSPSTP